MIIFKIIRWKNLLSTGNGFTEINLTHNKTTLIVGKNGAGKSTILDALCFVLFGKAFRKINKGNLINSINQKDCVVELEFVIGNKQYKIIRGIKPNVFEIYCDSVMVNQDAKARDYQDYLEKNILKLNYKSFTQIVILGSTSFTPFMQLVAADRRAIFEDLLDIQIFSTMNVLVKKKLSALKDSITKSKYALDLIAEKIKMQQQNIEDHQKRNTNEATKKKAELVEYNAQIEKLTNEIVSIQINIDELQTTISDKSTIDDKGKKLLQYEAKLDAALQKLGHDLSFFHDNDNCPTCKQILDATFKAEQIEQKESKRTELKNGIVKLKEELNKISERNNEISEVNFKINKLNNEITKNNSTITALNNQITKLQREIDDLEHSGGNVEEAAEKMKTLKFELATMISGHEELLIDRRYYEISENLLKDGGIKTKIIKQYLPIMNKLINKYLAAMDFFVNFNINENFEETIKSRHRDEFSYSSFSEGEKLRIDLALLFTWRQIAKLKNTTNTNLLILDEVSDSSLDETGTDSFLKLLHDVGADTNVFVISHKGDQLYDKFESTLRFEKKKNFSVMEKL